DRHGRRTHRDRDPPPVPAGQTDPRVERPTHPAGVALPRPGSQAPGVNSGVGGPMTEPNLNTSPLDAEHTAAGARMTDFAGWSMPLRYRGDLAEHHAVRERAGLFDLSHMGQIEISG